MKKTKRNLAAIVLLSFSLTAVGQGIVQDKDVIRNLEKENAPIIKVLKKDHNLKKVNIELEEQGRWHFVLTDKNRKKGIATPAGKVIIDPAYDAICYYPALGAGYSTFKTPEGYTMRIYHPFRYAHYECKNNQGYYKEYCFRSVKGEIFNDNVRSKEDLYYFPGYYGVNVREVFSGPSFGTNQIYMGFVSRSYIPDAGLLTSLGDVILEPEYDKFVFEEDLCKTTKTVDRVEKMGGFVLREPTKVVPAIFEWAFYKDGVWKVMRNKASKAEVYIPTESSKYEKVQYRDDGEKYYDQGELDMALNYYAYYGVQSPWSKYYTARILYDKTFQASTEAYAFWFDVVKLRKPHEIPCIDWPALCEQYEAAKFLALAYLTQDDDTYRKEAEQLVKDCEASVEVILVSRQPQGWIEEGIKELQVVNAEIYAREQQQQAIRQQQVQAISDAMSNILGSLYAGFKAPAQQTYNGSAYSSAPVVETGGSSSSSGSSSEPKKKVCRVCKGTGSETHEMYMGSAVAGKKKWCSDCGKEVPYGHTHRTCTLCHGTGLY